MQVHESALKRGVSVDEVIRMWSEGTEETVVDNDEPPRYMRLALDSSGRPWGMAALSFANGSRYLVIHAMPARRSVIGSPAPTGEIDLDDWDKVIDINLNGVLDGMRYQLPEMLKAGGENCAIVNMASIHGSVAGPDNGAYTAAKHGVVGITKNAAAEYGADDLRINSVGPGYINAPLLENSLSARQMDDLQGKHVLGRLGKAEEVSPLVCFLLHPRHHSSLAATT